MKSAQKIQSIKHGSTEFSQKKMRISFSWHIHKLYFYSNQKSSIAFGIFFFFLHIESIKMLLCPLNVCRILHDYVSSFAFIAFTCAICKRGSRSIFTLGKYYVGSAEQAAFICRIKLKVIPV